MLTLNISDAETVVELLEKVAAKFKGLPIYVVLDNARYQHCEYVKQLAASLNITLVFLPPYSPNLNLIERVWRYIKKPAKSRCTSWSEPGIDERRRSPGLIPCLDAHSKSAATFQPGCGDR